MHDKVWGLLKYDELYYSLWFTSIARIGFGFGLGHEFLYYAGFFHWFEL